MSTDYRQNLLQLLGDLEQAINELNKCKRRQCTQEISASNGVFDAFKKNKEALASEFRLGKIDLGTFDKKMWALKVQHSRTKESKALLACKVRECQSQVAKMIELSLVILAEACKHSKKACVAHNKGLAVLGGKKKKMKAGGQQQLDADQVAAFVLHASTAL